jgi:hypothetical protein
MTFLLELFGLLLMGLVVTTIVGLAAASCAMSVRRGSK